MLCRYLDLGLEECNHLFWIAFEDVVNAVIHCDRRINVEAKSVLDWLTDHVELFFVDSDPAEYITLRSKDLNISVSIDTCRLHMAMSRKYTNLAMLVKLTFVNG